MAFALVDHRLDGENHAGLQDDALSFAAVVQDLRGFVKTASDTVSAKFLYNGIACVFGNLLVGVADVAQGCAGFDGSDARHHRFVGDVNQALGDGGDFADGKHTAGVAVETVSFDGQATFGEQQKTLALAKDYTTGKVDSLGGILSRITPAAAVSGNV